VQQGRFLVRLPQARQDLLPDLLLVSREGWNDIRLDLDVLQGVAPDFGFVEVQQTGFSKELQIAITRPCFGIDPREIDRKGFLCQQIKHLFSALPGSVIASKLFEGEGFKGSRRQGKRCGS